MGSGCAVSSAHVRVPVLASLTFHGRGGNGPTYGETVDVGSGSLSIPARSRFRCGTLWEPGCRASWLSAQVCVRSRYGICSFIGTVSPVDRVIAALISGSVFSGGHDLRARFIRWNLNRNSPAVGPDHVHRSRQRRRLPAVDITPDVPKNGGLFRRVDGPQPRWEWLGNRIQPWAAWVRGITAFLIPNIGRS